MKSVNEVHLKGELARDPEVRYTASGKTVANITVVTKSKEHTDYHRVTAWENQAEKLKPLRKGAFIEVVGRLQTRSYEQQGQKRWVTEVVAWTISDGTTEKNAHGTEVSDADIPF